MCFFKFDGDAAKLSPVALGSALGLVKGLWMLGLAWAGWLAGVGMVMIERISQYHPGYSASFMGGVIGGLTGLVCGFIFGFVIAYLYNACLRCCKKSSDASSGK